MAVFKASWWILDTPVGMVFIRIGHTLTQQTELVISDLIFVCSYLESSSLGLLSVNMIKTRKCVERKRQGLLFFPYLV